MAKNEDRLGAVFVQVQDDLRQLRCRLEKISVSEPGKALDIQVLDNAIQKTESSIRKHAEDYLKKINEQLQVLPGIEELQTKKIPKWKPSLESFPDVHPRKEDLPRVSPREKRKSLLAKPLRHDPAHPNNRAVVFRKYGISLPDVHNKNTIRSKDHRIVTSLAVRPQVFGPKGRHSLAKPEEATGTDKKMLHRLIQHKAVSLNLKEDSHSAQIDSRSRSYKQLQSEPELGSTCEKTSIKCTPLWMTKTPPPSTTSRSVHRGIMMQSTIDLNPQNLPRNISRFTFTITNGRLNPMEADFCHFRQSFSLCWSSVVCALEALQKLLRNFAVPLAKVSGERLVEFAYGWDNGWRRAPKVISLLSVLENWEEVWSLVLRPGQRYKGEGGVEAAAIHIQSCWRRYIARTAYLSHCRRKWAAGTIAISWLMHAQMRRVRRALQARRFRQLENYRSRAQHLAANWKHIQSSKRTIIHIPSLGYSESERRKLRRFDVLQNIQINRLCEIRDENVEVIYICPRHLGEDVLHYQTSLLKCDGASDGSDTKPAEASSCVRRFIILTPEAVDYFPTHNMCLSTLLKYSPCTLKRIRNLIQGKESYIVGGVAHMDDLAVADELGVPILGPEPTISQYHSTKSGGRRIFTGAEVDVPPGQGDVYSLIQFHETLADLMAENFDVKRWLFKIDSEHSGRGTAYCDVRHLSCHNWAQQQYRRHGPELWKTKWIQEPVFLRYLDEIPEWLTRYAQPAKTSCYPNWACFLKTFLRQGGVVEAYPPSDSVTCLTVDLLLEPGGEVTMLSCGDQLHGSCQLEAIGSTVPQTSVHPETLRSICMRVGQACLQRRIVGYVSVDLATFLNRSTMEQKVWAIDLDLRYSDQLAMTQMLLMTTGGTLNFHTSCLEVLKPVREKCCENQIAAKPPVFNCHAVIGSNLFHSNLSMLYCNVFLRICKAHSLAFDMKRKEGTVFTLYDSSERCRIGMIRAHEETVRDYVDETLRKRQSFHRIKMPPLVLTVSEDLQGALVTFARNLSVIHQEISSSKMQGETNFKELIKDIENIQQMIVQNKLRAVKDKPAA